MSAFLSISVTLSQHNNWNQCKIPSKASTLMLTLTLSVNTALMTSLASDECTFGDFEGVLPSMQTCAEMVRDSPWMCYPGRGGEHCCASCARLANEENSGKHSLDLSQCKKNQWQKVRFLSRSSDIISLAFQ